MEYLPLVLALTAIGYIAIVHSIVCTIDYADIKTMNTYASKEGSTIKNIVITKKVDYVYLDNGVTIIFPKSKITNNYLINDIQVVKE